MFLKQTMGENRKIGHLARMTLLALVLGAAACVSTGKQVEAESEIDDVFYGDITEGLDAPLWDDEGMSYNPNDPIDRALSESPIHDREDWVESPRQSTAAAKKVDRKTKRASKKSAGGG